MILTAVVPSDQAFPWEIQPSLHGLIHAATAMIAPLSLLHPMRIAARTDATLAGLAVLYALALVLSATSLVIGFWRDDAPPLIGLAERLLALAAVAWIARAA